MRLASAVVAMLLTSASCGHSGPASPAPISPGRPFELRPGATARLSQGALSVTFKRLVNDSRCPQGVDCIWEGDAVVEVQLTAGRGEPVSVQLHTVPHLGNETTHEGFRVRLSAVAPYPRAGSSIEPGDYRVTLVVVAP